jgi:hypothetical protein
MTKITFFTSLYYIALVGNNSDRQHSDADASEIFQQQ